MLDWARARAEAASITESWRQEGGPGGAVVIFDTTGVREALSGGFAVIEHGLAFTPDTTNRFASISKHILATLLLQADVPFDAPLGTWLADLPEAFARLPLGRALDMTGALPDMMEVFWQRGVPYTASLSASEILAVAQRLPSLNGEPGLEMAYSNTGWRLGQLVLQKRLGIDYARAVDRLMAEFDLPIRFPQDETEIVPGLATGYWRDGESWRRGRYGFHFSASGGIAGSAAGLARWASALLAGRGTLAGMLERLTAPRAFADGSASVYRLGLVCSALEDVALVGHGGSLPGYRNHVLMAPAHGVGVVVLSNREEDALWLSLRVLAALLGRDLPNPANEVPTGLFATESGPFWAELAPDSISFMGGYERLVSDGDNGLRSLPAYLDIRLRQTGADTLEGTIGGVRRRLVRVPAETALDPGLPGRWRERIFGAEILIRPDGTAVMPWTGDAGIETVLTALPGGRALADLSHGPWRHRPCLCLQVDGSLHLASHRARVLQFDRIAEQGARS
ncbi:CubicO group peptidase (beta-lactamase class C family) [Bosea sp. BE125]|uniref:serine hydrolase domain-containing protein n=1 Tax=Bosea sp. BE125 TaxID=2817909 RepID=UPI002854D968|nr:serine hydrolase domain-containing protein [Bosea sp. BE125]MDR6872568.1 CubicO group peptidase (beta-lactamase class C family) [Bosea sp. BE125]